MKTLDNKVLFGANNSLEVYALDLQYSESISFIVTDEARQDCINLGVNRRNCHNFITNIEAFFDKILVCGSNAYSPLCRLYRSDTLENSSTIFFPNNTFNDRGFSSYDANHPSPVTFVSSNDQFYTFAQFSRFLPGVQLSMAPNFFLRNTTFVVSTPVNADQFLARPVTALSFHELGEFVYAYLTEPGIEVGAVATTFSRVVRVCKTDMGINPGADLLANFFQTFEKARIICRNERNGFIYNTMFGASPDQSPDGVTVVYGTFNAPLNGPPGGALCKFTFDPSMSGSIAQAFSGGVYLVQETVGNFVRTAADRPNNCPGSAGTPRTAEDSRRFILTTSPVDSSAFLITTFFVDKIQTEIIEHQEVTQEIIFYTSLLGDIIQLVRSNGSDYMHTLYVASREDQVRHFVLHKFNGSRNLVASTNTEVLQIIKGRCYCFSDCFTCLESKDPYCAWDARIQGCIPKLFYDDNPVTEAFSASAQDISRVCGVQEEPSPPIFPCPLRPPQTVITQEPMTTTAALPITTDEDLNFTNFTTDDVYTTGALASEEPSVIYVLNVGKYTDIFLALVSGWVTTLVLLTVGLFIPILNFKIKRRYAKKLLSSKNKS